MPGFVNYKKGCTRLTAASDQVYQLLAHGLWFSPGTPASSTTKTGRHDIAEIGVKHKKSNQPLTSIRNRCSNLHYKKLYYIVAFLIVWCLDLQLPMQLMPITTDVVSSNLCQGEVNNIM